MGLFVRDDPCYSENIRQIGFNRYKQLLALRFGQWWKVGMITLPGFLPLAGRIVCAVLTSSLLVLIPCSVLGGMIAGPFLAGLYDAISPCAVCAVEHFSAAHHGYVVHRIPVSNADL